MLFFIPAGVDIQRSVPGIQIHLMLFFIGYSPRFLIVNFKIQIHLMLFFIDEETTEKETDVRIQIHLMLFFIGCG